MPRKDKNYDFRTLRQHRGRGFQCRLESQIVFLVGLKALFEEEQSLRLADNEREELIRDNTRKLYMAATRAGQRLVLTYSGELPDILRQVIAQN